MACPDCPPNNLPQCGEPLRLVCLRSSTDATPTPMWVQAVCEEGEVTGYEFYADESGVELVDGVSFGDVIPCPADMRGLSCEGSVKTDLCPATMVQITDALETQTAAINAELDETSTEITTAVSNTNINYSYTGMLYNGLGDITQIDRVHPVTAAVERKIFTYADGNLTAVSGWMPV